MLFYDNFERICRERGTTPSGAVTAIGKNKTTAGNWKRNNTIPQEEVLVELADYLKCDVSDFFKSNMKVIWGSTYMDSYHDTLAEAENEMAQSTEELKQKLLDSIAEPPDMDDYMRDLLDVYRMLDHRDKLKLMNVVYEFADEHGVEL